VQVAVNRIQSQAVTFGAIQDARNAGFGSVSLDLIYGLPKQTRASFARTLTEVIAIRPERLSIFNYAHMPHLFKSQNQIDAATGTLLARAEIRNENRMLSPGLFDTPAEQLRNPDDPTGGVFRPGSGGPAPLVLVPLDEPDSDTNDEPTAPTAPTAPMAPAPAPDELVIAPVDADRFETVGAPVARQAPPGDLVIGAGEATVPLPVSVEPEHLPRRRRGFPWKILLGLLERLRSAEDEEAFMEATTLAALVGLETDLSPAAAYRIVQALTTIDPERTTACIIRGERDQEEPAAR